MRESQTHQNAGHDLVRVVQTIQSDGMVTAAGMIAGVIPQWRTTAP
jgi:hypothetical protein